MAPVGIRGVPPLMLLPAKSGQALWPFPPGELRVLRKHNERSRVQALAPMTGVVRPGRTAEEQGRGTRATR
jgi:hypothetical protein